MSKAGLLVATLALLTSSLNPHAYLDPGSGSLLFQSFLALLFSIGASWRWFRKWVQRTWTRMIQRKSCRAKK